MRPAIERELSTVCASLPQGAFPRRYRSIAVSCQSRRDQHPSKPLRASPGLLQRPTVTPAKSCRAHSAAGEALAASACGRCAQNRGEMPQRNCAMLHCHLPSLPPLPLNRCQPLPLPSACSRSMAGHASPPPVLLLLKGPPGSGKSTLAAALVAALRWPLIDKDDARSSFQPLAAAHSDIDWCAWLS